MHEMAITQSMFDLVLQHAEEAGTRKVGKINLVIGELTGVVGECVQFYLEFLSRGTVVEGAMLDVTLVPAKARCRRKNWSSCAGCGRLILGGKRPKTASGTAGRWRRSDGGVFALSAG